MRMSAQQLKRKLVETSPKAARPPLKQQYRQEEAQKPKMQRQKMVDNLELLVDNILCRPRVLLAKTLFQLGHGSVRVQLLQAKLEILQDQH